VARAIDVAPLEFGRCEPEEGRGAAHIGCREINEALLSATCYAARLACETEPFGHVSLSTVTEREFVVYFDLSLLGGV
jgi:hypothetical protein